MEPSSNQRTMDDRDVAPPCKPRNGRLVIALGDPAGIGAEVTLKALALPVFQDLDPLLVGCRRWLTRCHRQLRARGDVPLADLNHLDLLDLPLDHPITAGCSSPEAGAASFAWLTRAADLVLQHSDWALVTAPIAKASWHAAGHRYPGQTERLAELAGVPSASMLFTARSPAGSWRMNTLLATTHIPLAQVPERLSPELLSHQLNRLLEFCRRFTERPRLVVAGLNPHAGEQGQLGLEEVDWLIPALQRWRSLHPQVDLEGPMPPDTCWLEAAAAWRGDRKGPDGYLALYHDQGLIPTKLLAFDAAVNTTLGLPFLRTSPDHGTAFDIAGRGVARPESMAAAIATAMELGIDSGAGLRLA